MSKLPATLKDDSMLIITRGHYEAILEYSRQQAPLEACGLIGGFAETGSKVVQKVCFLNNLDQSSEHFSMDPKEQFAAVKEMRRSGWVLLGNFHSHPASPARPSEEDKRLAFDGEASYLILSLADGENPVLKSFRIQNGNAWEEEIQFKEEEQYGSGL